MNVILIYDQVLRMILSRAYSLHYLRYESQIWCGDVYWYDGVSCTIYGSLNLTSDIVFKIIMPGAYLFYYLREESQFCCADQ